MKLARSRRGAVCALAGLAAVCAAPAFAADDKSTILSVMELVGVSTDPDVSKIDYSERPKLVLPPNRGALPEPATRAERPASWPVEAGAERSRSANRFARVPNAPPDEKKKSLMERIRGARPTSAPGTDDEPGLLQRALMAGKNSDEPVMDEPNRRMLTEPPSGYRRPTQDLSKVRDPDTKKQSWWNPLSWTGGKENDSDPVARPGAATPADQKSGGGGGFTSMLPSFMRGSDSR